MAHTRAPKACFASGAPASLTIGKRISCATVRKIKQTRAVGLKIALLLQSLNIRGHVRRQPHGVGIAFAPENPKGLVGPRAFCVLPGSNRLVATIALGAR